MKDRIEIRGCRNYDELLKVVRLCDAAFEKTPYEYFERHILKDVTLSPEDTRILIVDNEIVSSVQVFPRTMYLKGGKIDFGGIGNVATYPAKRKFGYAELVMNDAINYMKEQEFKFSLLTTTINKYYDKFSFETLNRELIEINKVSPNFHKSIRKFNRVNDFGVVKNIYEYYNRDGIGPLFRDIKYWEAQFDFCGEDENLFLVFETTNSVEGYIRAVRENDKIKILEFAAVNVYLQIFKSLIESLCYQTGINDFEMFLSESEKQKLQLKNYISKIDSDLMILLFENRLTELQKRELTKYNNINYWLSDFF